VALPLGWLAYQLNWIRERHGVLHKPPHGVQVTMTENRFLAGARSPSLPGLPISLKLLGENSVYHFLLEPDNEDVRRKLRSLFPEAIVENDDEWFDRHCISSTLNEVAGGRQLRVHFDGSAVFDKNDESVTMSFPSHRILVEKRRVTLDGEELATMDADAPIEVTVRANTLTVVAAGIVIATKALSSGRP